MERGMLNESSDIRCLSGVGDRRAELYAKLGVFTLGGLLRHYPRDYIDLSAAVPIAGAPIGEKCAVRAVLTRKSREQRIRANLSIFKAAATDGESDLQITFFNAKYTVEALNVGTEYIFYGTMGGTVLRREMDSPMVIRPDAEGGFQPFIPLYPLTAGLSSRMIAANVASALRLIGERVEDPLPASVRLSAGLCGLEFAFRAIHLPQSREALASARERLVFDEIFAVSLGMALERDKNRLRRGAAMLPADTEEFAAGLPFELTGAQKRSVREITGAMTRSWPMNRLLQGDVGSGKTVVAAAAIWFAYKNGFQSVLMAPTELLAEQHCKTLSTLLAPFGINVELLTGAVTQKNKTAIKERVLSGETDVLVGTHAVIEKDVGFARLGLVVTDEQHRFGVGQRFALASKGEAPHMLTMSATPIPRTLASAIYGDLETSVIDELPRGRVPVKTYVIDSGKRERAYGFVKKQLEAGWQGYIVCPLVEREEGSAPELVSAVEYAKKLEESGYFDGYGIGVLHGRMRSAEKDAVMRRFASGELKLLVATTVIEVGIDVPNAVIMLIENAERFGLSQLHQLRGRVGRGAAQSWCVLISDARGGTAKSRLDTIKNETDGFRIAEADLRLRGPGDFFGMRQHGEADGRLMEMLGNEKLGELAKKAADGLLREDPQLQLPEHARLRQLAARTVELVNK